MTTQRYIKYPNGEGGSLTLVNDTLENSQKRILLLGDSQAGNCNAQLTLSALTASNGVATATVTGNPIITGDTVAISGASTSGFNGLFTATRVDNTTFTFPVSTTLNGSAGGTPLCVHPRRMAAIGWQTWGQALSKCRAVQVANYGVVGSTTADILNRLVWIDSNKFDAVSLIIGINDITADVATTTIITNLGKIYDYINNLGLDLFTFTIFPLGASHGSYNVNVMSRIEFVNKWIREQRNLRKRTYLVDSFKALTDPAQALGAAKANYLNTSDNIHLFPLGARAIGAAYSTVLNSVYPVIDTLASTQLDSWTSSLKTITAISASGGIATATSTGHSLIVGDSVFIVAAEAAFSGQKTILSVPDANTFTYAVASSVSGNASGTMRASLGTNLLDNPLLLTAGGTVTAPATGSVAAGWTATRLGSASVAYSMVSRSDGAQDIQAVITSTAALNDGAQLQSSVVQSRLTYGDKFIVEADVSWTGATNMTRFIMLPQLSFEGVGMPYEPTASSNTTVAAFDNSDFSGVFRSQIIEVPQGTNATITTSVT